MPEIDIKNLTIAYEVRKTKKEIETIQAVDDLSCRFEDGMINVIIGASGCGKSTLIRSIIGLQDPNEGTISFDGVIFNYYPPNERNVSYVSQELVLYPKMTLFANIALPLKLRGIDGEEIRQRVNQVADLLGIRPILTRKPKEVSIGQAQRACIAKAMVKRPALYVFDEPFSNLDKPLADQLTREMKTLFGRLKSTVIFVSHDIRQAVLIADRLYVMENGKMIVSGTPEEVMKSKDKRVKGYFADL